MQIFTIIFLPSNVNKMAFKCLEMGYAGSVVPWVQPFISSQSFFFISVMPTPCLAIAVLLNLKMKLKMENL